MEFPMNYFPTQLNELLLKHNFNLEVSCKELIRSNLELAINKFLQAELTAVLQYERYEHRDHSNYRNWSYIKESLTEIKLSLCCYLVLLNCYGLFFW